MRWFFPLRKVLSIVAVHLELISELRIKMTSHKQICRLESTLSCQHRTATRHQGWKVTGEVTQGVLPGPCPSHIPAPGQLRGRLVDNDCPARAVSSGPGARGHRRPGSYSLGLCVVTCSQTEPGERRRVQITFFSEGFCSIYACC